MKGKTRKMLFLLMAVIFICAGGLMLRQLLDARSAAASNDYAQAIANIPPPPGPAAKTPPETTPESLPEATEPTHPEELPDAHARSLQELNLTALQDVNPDVIGWILLPDTDINYPLLHTTDNSTYLHTAWDGTDSVSGSIFLETRSDPNFVDFNTIIYGHHMRNGSMFAPLMGYKDAEFLTDHANIYIATADGVRRYTVFSAYEAPVTSDTYRLYFKNTAQKQTALDFYLDSSHWEPPITPTANDQLLTLSTCTGTGRYETRWVVQAVLSGFWANKKAGSPEETSFSNMVISPQEP